MADDVFIPDDAAALCTAARAVEAWEAVRLNDGHVWREFPLTWYAGLAVDGERIVGHGEDPITAVLDSAALKARDA
jgi:hypothetical protein